MKAIAAPSRIVDPPPSRSSIHGRIPSAGLALVFVFLLGLPVGDVLAGIGTDRETLIYPPSDHRLQIDYGRATGANEDTYG